MTSRDGMRAITADMETLDSGQFILLVGLGAGLLRGVPRFLLVGSTTDPTRAVVMSDATTTVP